MTIDGMRASKASTAVTPAANLLVAESAERSWVSRGAHKLIGALDAFGVSQKQFHGVAAGPVARAGGWKRPGEDRSGRVKRA